MILIMDKCQGNLQRSTLHRTQENKITLFNSLGSMDTNYIRNDTRHIHFGVGQLKLDERSVLYVGTDNADDFEKYEKCRIQTS